MEVFFASIPVNPASEPMTYYARTDRMPPWLLSGEGEVPFPVTPARSAQADRLLLPAIAPTAIEGRQFAMFETRFNGVPYQVVAFLRYADTTRERVVSTVGFAVNLDWVRTHYFDEIVAQILRMQGPDPGLALRISDATGATVVETRAGGEGPSSSRRFPLAFFSPSLVALGTTSQPGRVYWAAQATTVDDYASAARDGARRVTIKPRARWCSRWIRIALQAIRANSRLTAMKSEFVRRSLTS